MAYGLQVLNADGRVQIDSTEIAPNTFISNVTTTAYSAMTYPPSNFATGDLVLARAANSPLSGPTYIGISQPIMEIPYYFQLLDLLASKYWRKGL